MVTVNGSFVAFFFSCAPHTECEHHHHHCSGVRASQRLFAATGTMAAWNHWKSSITAFQKGLNKDQDPCEKILFENDDDIFFLCLCPRMNELGKKRDVGLQWWGFESCAKFENITMCTSTGYLILTVFSDCLKGTLWRTKEGSFSSTWPSLEWLWSGSAWTRGNTSTL